MKKDLYLFRHGESEWNRLNKMQVTTDSPLTENGIEQAKRLPKYLRDKNLGIIYSSHLKRAWKTGSIVAQELGVEIIKKPNLFEIFCGDVDGLTRLELRDRFGSGFIDRWKGINPIDDYMRFPNGESKMEARSRILEAVSGLSYNSPFNTIGFASHGSVIRQIVIACGNKDADSFKNCEILHLEFNTNKYNEENLSEAFKFIERIRVDS
jgi:probable phosphoglycerate mutase